MGERGADSTLGLLKQGWLEKYGVGVLGSPTAKQRRFCELSVGLLTYYKATAGGQEKKKRGAITLIPTSVVAADPMKACTFYVTPIANGRVFHFTTENEAECKDWVTQLKLACASVGAQSNEEVKDSAKQNGSVDDNMVVFHYLVSSNRSPPHFDNDQKALEQGCSNCKVAMRSHNKVEKLDFCRVCGHVHCIKCSTYLVLPPSFVERGESEGDKHGRESTGGGEGSSSSSSGSSSGSSSSDSHSNLVRVCYNCEFSCRLAAKANIGENIMMNADSSFSIFPPKWISKSTYRMCSKCVTRGRNGHNCRFCGLLFCDKCTTRQSVPEAFEKNLVDKWRDARVCDRCRFLVAYKNAKLRGDVVSGALPHGEVDKSSFVDTEVEIQKLGKNLDRKFVGKLRREACGHCYQKLHAVASQRHLCPQCSKQFCVRCINEHVRKEQQSLLPLSPSSVRRTPSMDRRNQLRRQKTTKPINMVGCTMSATITNNPSKALAQLAAMSRKHIKRGQRSSAIPASPTAVTSPRGLNISVEGIDPLESFALETPRAAAVSETALASHEDSGNKGTNTEESGRASEGSETDFEILCRLGEGSYGTVYKAMDKRSNRLVAIKVIEDQSEPDKIEELMNEVKFMAECTSEHLVAYRGTYQMMGERTCIAMEYCCGGSLSDIIDVCDRTFEEKEIAIIMRETLMGLSYMHKNLKIHRDLKAANILLTERGECKLADFGVSCRLTSMQDRRRTMIGTPYWMAPEVLQAKENNGGYDAKADVWSLGITALELAKGVPPMSDVHPMRAIYKIPFAPSPALPDPENWSTEFADFIAQCVNKDQIARPSAETLLKHPFIVSAGALSVLCELVGRVMGEMDEFRTREPPKEQGSDDDEDGEMEEGTSGYSLTGASNGNSFDARGSLDRPQWERGTSQIELEVRKTSDCSYRYNHI